jgi:transcriptional regulator with XRE-family HTH domain
VFLNHETSLSGEWEDPQMKSDSLPFGAKLRAMREEKGLGLRELAGRAKISPAFLSKIEAGKEKAPAEPKLRALAKVLDFDPDAMLAMAGRLSADVVKIIQKHPKEYAALIMGLRVLNQEQLQAAGRSIMKTYEIEIPPDQREKMIALFAGVKRSGEVRSYSFKGALQGVKLLDVNRSASSSGATQPKSEPLGKKRPMRSVPRAGERL